MTHTSEEVARIAAGLSEAQRRWMTTGVERCEPVLKDVPDDYRTMPPSNTHAVLFHLGLVDRSGFVSATGLAVRDHLMKGKSDGK